MGTALGYQWVKASLRKHKRNTKKVVAATLISRTAGNVEYKNAYVHPQDTNTGIGGGGHPDTLGTVTLWRIKETTAPVVDDKITVGGATRQIVRVQPRLNGDESRHFAVYDLTVVI